MIRNETVRVRHARRRIWKTYLLQRVLGYTPHHTLVSVVAETLGMRYEKVHLTINMTKIEEYLP